MARYGFKEPDSETFIAEHGETGAKLYAELAPVPLYANARLIAGALGIGKRQSFRMGWLIGPQRIARGHDVQILPADLLAWCAARLTEVYPDHTTASGMNDDEVAELEAEQKQKRDKYKAKRE